LTVRASTIKRCPVALLPDSDLESGDRVGPGVEPAVVPSGLTDPGHWEASCCWSRTLPCIITGDLTVGATLVALIADRMADFMLTRYWGARYEPTSPGTHRPAPTWTLMKTRAGYRHRPGCSRTPRV